MVIGDHQYQLDEILIIGSRKEVADVSRIPLFKLLSIPSTHPWMNLCLYPKVFRQALVHELSLQNLLQSMF